MKLKNMVIGFKVVRKNPKKDSNYFVVVTDLDEEINSFSGVIIHAESQAPYELGDFIDGLHPKYFKAVQVH